MRHFLAASLCVLAACSGGAPDGVQPGNPLSTPPFALQPPAEGAALPELPPAPSELLLVPGDVIHISVYRQPDLELEIRVPQEGSISYPLIGSVQVAGRTGAAVEKALRDRLEKDYLNDPQVSVTVKEYAKRKVYVFGGVKEPGSYDLPPTERLTLLQLIATAGGFTDRAYREFAQIVRRKPDGDRESIRLSIVELERAVAKGSARLDPELWPDDLIVIPSAARVVYVMGAVNQPGWFEIPADTPMTVAMAVSRAGSYTKFAATGRIQVLRHLPTGESQKFAVNLDAVLNGQLDQDAELRPGDVVYVPERGIF